MQECAISYWAVKIGMTANNKHKSLHHVACDLTQVWRVFSLTGPVNENTLSGSCIIALARGNYFCSEAVESELVYVYMYIYVRNVFGPGNHPQGLARVQDVVLTDSDFSMPTLLCAAGAWTIRELLKSITVF